MGAVVSRSRGTTNRYHDPSMDGGSRIVSNPSVMAAGRGDSGCPRRICPATSCSKHPIGTNRPGRAPEAAMAGRAFGRSRRSGGHACESGRPPAFPEWRWRSASGDRAGRKTDPPRGPAVWGPPRMPGDQGHPEQDAGWRRRNEKGAVMWSSPPPEMNRADQPLGATFFSRLPFWTSSLVNIARWKLRFSLAMALVPIHFGQAYSHAASFVHPPCLSFSIAATHAPQPMHSASSIASSAAPLRIKRHGRHLWPR